VWQQAPLFAELRQPQGGGACTSCSAYDACRGGCMAAKFFTGLPLDGPDPECVKGHGGRALLAHAGASAPRPSGDHSHRTERAGRPAGPSRPVPVSIGLRPPSPAVPSPAVPAMRPPDRACDENPLAGFRPGAPLIALPPS
jgi:hypothetical protein